MSRVEPTSIISHWNQRIEGMQQSSDAFYTEVERVIASEGIEGVRMERVSISEGGFFSSKR